MTEMIPSTVATTATTAVASPNQERIRTLANIIENLTGHRLSEGLSLVDQAHWLAVMIDEQPHGYHDVSRLAGIGLDLSRHHVEDDDTLGEQLFFLFGEIAEAVIAEHSRPGAN